ncbi:MAG TPA: hypothetical protein VHG08_08050, partial [Longimicrobium sp.]|nr:hypothetical protein [Longimicrobium sp.]
GMRALISLLLLASFAWSRALAADCPMAFAPQGQPDGAAASASTPHEHHGHPQAPAAPADRHDAGNHPPSPAQHAAGGCAVMTACGATAAPPAPAPLAASDLPRADGAAADRGSYASPSLASDPPPPRIALRS